MCKLPEGFGWVVDEDRICFAGRALIFTDDIFCAFFNGVDSAKDFLTKLDYIHEAATRGIENARPPRFELKWENHQTLVMTYVSERNLVDLAIGLAKGIGRFYRENLTVTKLDDRRVQIVFR